MGIKFNPLACFHFLINLYKNNHHLHPQVSHPFFHMLVFHFLIVVGGLIQLYKEVEAASSPIQPQFRQLQQF